MHGYVYALLYKLYLDLYSRISSAAFIMSAENGEAEPLTPSHGTKSPEELEEIVLSNPRTTTPQNQQNTETGKTSLDDGGENGVKKEIIANSRTETPQNVQTEKKDIETEKSVLAEETDGG